MTLCYFNNLDSNRRGQFPMSELRQLAALPQRTGRDKIVFVAK